MVVEQRLQHGANGRLHFARRGMPADRLFTKDQLPVHDDVEDAAAGRNEPPRRDVVFQFALVQDFGRQTDGALGMVSGRAVLDADFQN